MKKTILLVAISVLISLTAFAQNEDTKRADKHFKRLEFVEAAKDYERLVEAGKANGYVYRQLAESYYNIFETVKAEQNYRRALKTYNEPELVFKYAQMLKANGKYEASNMQMAKFAEMKPNDERAIAFNKNPRYLPKLLERTEKFSITNLPFNSEYSDFGGTLQGGKLYITSARNTSRKTYGWNEQPFLDIYELSKNPDGSYQNPIPIQGKINTKYHEGVVSFSPDGQTLYFSRESFFEKSYEKDETSNLKYSLLHVFKATKTGNDWSNVEALKLNSDTYSVKNPRVSSNGKTLYFASDMPGGFGLFDIYKAALNKDGSVGDPINLGSRINTPAQEMFPYISSNNTLYFSSNGHLGLGGLDVFYASEIDGEMTTARNIGIPINSNADDFAFYLDETSAEGFVSSNRKGGVGSDDIYAIKKLRALCDFTIISKVSDDKTGVPISNATVSVLDLQGNMLSTKSTNAKGIAEFILACDQSVQLEIIKPDYESKKVTVNPSEEENLEIPINLEPIEKLILADRIELKPIYFDFDKSNITAKAAFELDKLVQIMTKYPELIIDAKSHTDNRGTDAYNFNLSNRRAKTTVQYVISKGIDSARITGEGKGENDPKVDCTKGCNEEQHQMNRRSEFLIVGK